MPEAAANDLPTIYQQFIAKSRYARWLPEQKRRETWGETVARYFDFFAEHLQENHNFKLTQKLRTELEQSVLDLQTMPSMRCLMTAGPALKKDNIAGYNCSYVAVDHPRAFDEILYILMNGTGVGFSVERQYIQKLPTVAEELFETDTTIIVSDSKLGWAKAFKEIVSLLYSGQIPRWDTSRVRPAGAPLKTFGGRASGPEPLEDLFNFTVNIFRAAAGRILTSLECHDIVCKTAEIVVVGGVRRSALISLSNLSDERMRQAKMGEWWVHNVQRKLANNSISFSEKPEVGTFMKEWSSIYESKSGERGIFNRVGAQEQVKRISYFRQGTKDITKWDREWDWEFGVNPCSEIILRMLQFCNLTEVVVKPGDNPDTLKEKVRLATIMGTWQATLTDFKYIRNDWKKNCEEERLLGVSLTGIMDNGFLNGRGMQLIVDELPNILTDLRQVAIDTNKEWAKKLGINPAAAITCVKPSGTVSQLVDTASGIHARHGEYFIRTVRADNKDPMTKFMMEAGFPNEPDVTAPEHTTIFSFPFQSPEFSVFRQDRTAIEQLELWLAYQYYWCEHKPSITVYLNEEDWPEVGAWVWKNFDAISGISFLPNVDHVYRQAPYQDCTKKEYEAFKKDRMPKEVDWTKLSEFEDKDMTAGAQTYACAADGACDIVDIGSVAGD